MHFTTNNISIENLIKEDKNSNNIYIIVNTVIDPLKTTIKKEYRNEYLIKLEIMELFYSLHSVEKI